MKPTKGLMVLCLTAMGWSGAALAQGAGGHGPMMHGQGAMNCPMGPGGMGLMHDPEVKMNVAETASGITVTWTSSNPAKAAELKKMGQHMESMHSTQVTKPSP